MVEWVDPVRVAVIVTELHRRELRFAPLIASQREINLGMRSVGQLQGWKSEVSTPSPCVDLRRSTSPFRMTINGSDPGWFHIITPDRKR